jgi:hypothetical protein
MTSEHTPGNVCRPGGTFNRKVDALRRRLSLAKAPATLALQVNELNLSGEDAPWKPVIDGFKTGGLPESCRIFVELLEVQVDQRCLVTDVEQKSDRFYVDRHLRALEDSINESIATETQKQTEEFRLQLQAEHDMLSVIKQYTQDNIDSLKAALNQFRKDATEVAETQDAPLAFVPRPLRPLPPVRHETPTESRSPGLVKTPYKRRTKPFAPKPMGTVLGVSINHLSPRARASTMINHKNMRYSIPF